MENRKEIFIENEESHNYLVMTMALFLGYTMIYVDKMTIGIALIPIAQEFNLTPVQTGYILSAFFLGYTLFQIPMGYLATKVNTKYLLVFSIFGLGCYMILFGITPVPMLGMLIAIRFMASASAHSGYPSSCSRMVSVHIPVEKRTFAQGILIGSSGLSMFIGSLILSRIYTSVGWRNGFYGMAVIAFIVAAILFLVLPSTKPQPKNNLNKSVPLPFSKILSSSLVWKITVSSFCFNACAYGLTGFLPSYLQAERNLSLIASGNIMAVLGLAAFLVSLIGGYIIGKFFDGKENIVIFMLTFIAAIFIYLMYSIDNIIVCTAFLALAYMLLVLAFVIITSLPLKLFPKEHVAPYYATIGAGGVAGGFFAPTIIGTLVEVGGGSYYYAFVFLAVLSAACGIVMLLVKKSTLIKLV